MNICFVTMQFPAPTEAFASNDLLSLSKMNNSISIFGLKFNHKRHFQMINDRGLEGINISNISFKNLFISILHPAMFFYLFFLIIKMEYKKPNQIVKNILLIPSSISTYKKIEKLNPDIVHLFWGHYPVLVGYLLRRYANHLPVTIFLGAYDLEMDLALSNYFAKKAEVVFTHSEVNINALLKKDIKRKNIKVIHRGVDINLIDRTIKHIKKVPMKVLSAGRLIKEKNFKNVLKVFADLHKFESNFDLEIVGSGPEKLKLEKLAKKMKVHDNVTFTSHLSQIDLFRRMAESEYFIFLSNKKSERLPNVLKEAMQCGCVCISSKTKGIEELMQHGVNGFTMSDFNPHDVRKYFLLSDNEKRNIIRQAKEIIYKKFNLIKSSTTYHEIWQELISQ